MTETDGQKDLFISPTIYKVFIHSMLIYNEFDPEVPSCTYYKLIAVDEPKKKHLYEAKKQRGKFPKNQNSNYNSFYRKDMPHYKCKY